MSRGVGDRSQCTLIQEILTLILDQLPFQFEGLFLSVVSKNQLEQFLVLKISTHSPI